MYVQDPGKNTRKFQDNGGAKQHKKSPENRKFRGERLKKRPLAQLVAQNLYYSLHLTHAYFRNYKIIKESLTNRDVS